MNASSRTPPIRAVVVTAPQDDPNRVIHLALALHRHADFEVTVVACAARSSVETLPSRPTMVDGPMTGAGATLPTERKRDETQERCDKIAKALIALPEDERPEVGYIEGSSYQIAAALSSAFDLVMVPHSVRLPNMLELWFPDLDTRLALLTPIPTLFCLGPLNWQSIIIVQTGDRASWWAAQILSRMSSKLDTPVHQWFPGKLDVMEPQPSGADGIYELDAATIPADQQPDSCLVVPVRVARSVFRFRKVRRVLYRWQGSCLVWP